jgi:phospholipid/cholesterol/gamma-HCH transport system substrate-binding protein
MEIRARYTLIGIFTLAVICAGFAFVYWLNAAGGLGRRASYKIRYDGPVSGLLKGSAVLFNGVRVGEVTSLQLDAANPRDVTVAIAIDHLAPVRADTAAGIEFQGLTGAPVVSLIGGTPSLPLLGSNDGTIPLLTAEKNAGQGMTQAARDVLRHIDSVVTENAEPLKNLIANIDKFSGALARNTDRVDGIIAGVERLTGGGQKAVSRIYDLTAPRTITGIAKVPAGQLLVPEPTTLSIFDTDKIPIRSRMSDKPVLENAQWPDLLPKVIQARIVQAFENANYTGAIGRAPEGTKADSQLLIDIRSFQIVTDPDLIAEVELSAKISGNDGQILGTRLFRASRPLATLDAPTASKAISDAFEEVATEIVKWACQLQG